MYKKNIYLGPFFFLKIPYLVLILSKKNGSIRSTVLVYISQIHLARSAHGVFSPLPL